MKVGIIGCGNIADIYFKNSQKYFNNCRDGGMREAP